MRLAISSFLMSVAALLSLGLVMLYSSSTEQVGPRFLVAQLIWCGLGLGLCLAAARMDYQLLKKIALPVFVVAVVLLALVLLTGKVNGARRWFKYGVARLQPSEFAKLALIIVLAWYIEMNQRLMSTWKRGILIPCVLIGLPLALIFIEPDRGTTILLAGVSGVLLVLGGVRWLYIVPPVLLAAGGLVFSLWHDPMRARRIFSWWHLEDSKTGTGYQAYQAMVALGSGGWAGQGLGNGRQKLGFVPEHHTDFIFSVIGEELGLIATMLVLVAFVVIVISGLYISINARDTFGLLLGSGITFLIGMQAFINIGVVTSALPNKGLPLPFISYGGSNLLVMLTGVGFLISIARQARGPENIFASTKTAEDVAYA